MYLVLLFAEVLRDETRLAGEDVVEGARVEPLEVHLVVVVPELVVLHHRRRGTGGATWRINGTVEKSTLISPSASSYMYAMFR